MYINNLINSPFFLSLVLPSVFSFPVDWNHNIVGSDTQDSTPADGISEQIGAARITATPSPALDLRAVVDKREDGGCIVFVNARDPNALPMSTCDLHYITEREVPTVAQEVVAATPTYTSTQIPTITPTATPVSGPQHSQKQEFDIEPDSTAKRQDSDQDSDSTTNEEGAPVVFGDTRLTPFINARDVPSDARDITAVVERDCTGRPADPVINGTDTENRRRGEQSCPYVNARDAGPPPPYVNARGPQDHEGNSGIYPPFVNAREAGNDPPYVNARNDPPYVNARNDPPYVNARNDPPYVNARGANAEADLASR